MKITRILTIIAAGLALPAFAAEQEIHTDTGTLSEAEGAQVYKKPGY
jgi:hypothetical protein